MASIDDVILVSPTRIPDSLLRGSEGKFAAPRGGGKSHQGIDIVANKSSEDKEIYRVMATGSGVVAYSRINGTEDTGYGFTVVIDHKNGFYTLYAHLAIHASAGLAEVGQAVVAGATIGYLADLVNGELSSGNARKVLPYDKIQLHFECFEAEPGLSSTGGLAQIFAGRTLDDPTNRLLGFGYQSF